MVKNPTYLFRTHHYQITDRKQKNYKKISTMGTASEQDIRVN